jgi:hypothetical protein
VRKVGGARVALNWNDQHEISCADICHIQYQVNRMQRRNDYNADFHQVPWGKLFALEQCQCDQNKTLTVRPYDLIIWNLPSLIDTCPYQNDNEIAPPRLGGHFRLLSLRFLEKGPRL